MTKRLLYNIITFVILLLPIESIMAQCESIISDNNFESYFKINITEGTCTGTISVDIDNQSYKDNMSFLYSVDGDNGFAKNTDKNIIDGLPGGTYTLTIKGTCKTNGSQNRTLIKRGLFVKTQHQQLKASKNTSEGRNSYKDVNLGIIALDVTQGTGAATYKFEILEAPAGMPTGVIVPVVKNGVYVFPKEDYAPGDYKILVKDDCFTLEVNYKIDEITGLPDFNTKSSSQFYSNKDLNSCSLLYTRGQLNSISKGNSNYVRYIKDGLYEIAITKMGTPVDDPSIKWSTWSDGYNTMDISPYTYGELYGKNSTDYKLVVYRRLKNSNSIYESHNSYIQNPSSYPIGINTNTTGYDCDHRNSKVEVGSNNSSSSIICFPADIKVENDKGEIIFSSTAHTFGNYPLDEEGIKMEYGKKYQVKITTADGVLLETSSTVSFSGTSSFINTSRIKHCNTYDYSFHMTNGLFVCDIIVTIKDPQNTVIFSEKIKYKNEQGEVIRYLCDNLEYGEKYTVEVKFGDKLYTTSLSEEQTRPNAYEITIYESNYQSVDRGQLRLRSAPLTGQTSAPNIPLNTTFTFYKQGDTTPIYTYTNTNNSNSVNSSHATMPAGIYDVIIDDQCGSPIKMTYDHKGFYNADKIAYRLEEDCSALILHLDNSLTEKGEDVPNQTYYKVIRGPQGGHETSVRQTGESLKLYMSGYDYVIAVMARSNTTSYLRTDTIRYEKEPFSYLAHAIGSYVCKKSSVGTMLIKAQGGIPDYTYELFDMSGNKINIEPQFIDAGDETDIAMFNYGSPKESYRVKITDKCNSSIFYDMYLTDLEEIEILYSSLLYGNSACVGNSITLGCIPLGPITYQWTGPNGFISTERINELTNATIEMSGVYKAKVTPIGCGEEIEDQIQIFVYEPITEPITDDQETCVKSPAPLVLDYDHSKGHSGIGGPFYTYQWQISTDGGSNWSNISGATSKTYQVPGQTKSGTYLFRRITTDSLCGKIYGKSMVVIVNPCYAKVNPNISTNVDKP